MVARLLSFPVRVARQVSKRKMCLNGDNPALTANIVTTNCPHIEPGETGTRVNFCGCCMHRMCDFCAAAHPMPTRDQEKMIPYPCHLIARGELSQREQARELDLNSRFRGPYEYHIDVIV